MARAQDIAMMKDKVIQTCLDLASAQAWDDVLMMDIAAHAGYKEVDIRAIFADKMDIIQAYARQVDAQVIENMNGAFTGAESCRDKIFDIIMERFDVLNENRKAVLSILNAVTLDPKSAITTLPWVAQSMAKMMDVAGIDAQGIKGGLRVAGLSLAYLKTLRDWAGDESVDMAQTMSSLDKSLGFLERLENRA